MQTLIDTTHPAIRRAALGPLGLCVLLTACATTAPEAVKESLDEHTGLTVTHLDKPLALLRTAARGSSADPFVFLAPFETDRMGTRSIYLWLAVPAIEPIVEPPQVSVDEAGLEMRTLESVAGTGLSRSPYRKPEPWSIEFYYAVDAAQLARLARGTKIDAVVHYAEMGEQHFVLETASVELAGFADRVVAR